MRAAGRGGGRASESLTLEPRGPFSLQAAAEFGFGPNQGRAPAFVGVRRKLAALSAATASGPAPLPRGYFRSYTLVQQPASQRWGSCARLLIQDNGEREIVYAAHMAP